MDKFKQNQVIHQMPAGLLLSDSSTEMFGCRETKKVFAISKGKTIQFSELNPIKKALIFEQLLNDDHAIADLKELSQSEAIEEFAFCLYGGLDHIPDFDSKGNLKASENFRCSNNCRCLKWNSKSISINGNKLTPRQIEIISLFASDLPDKQIADQLHISESTLDTHKRHLFEKFNVQSKSGLITKAISNKIIQ